MNKKPVYLYVTPFFPAPEAWQGGYCYDAVRALMRTGRYDVKVIRAGSGACRDDYDYSGIKVHRVHRKALPCGLAPFFVHHWNCNEFRRRLDELGIDPADVAVCHCHVMECAPYAAEFHKWNPNTLTILHHHSTSMVNLFSGRLKIVPVHATLLYFYYRRLCESIDLHAFVSTKSMESYGKMFRDGPGSEFVDTKDKLLFGKFMRPIALPKGIVFYNGYDPALYNTVDRPVHDEDTFTIGCVANFYLEKDQMTLIRALGLIHREIKGLRVKFIGSGPTLELCKRMAKDAGIGNRTEFMSEIDHSEIPVFYRSIDLMPIPSRLEGFCCAYVESVACGTPIMGCRGISIEEVIDESEKDKWLVEPYDYRALADKILFFYRNRSSFSFNRDLRIDTLWNEFLDELEAIRGAACNQRR